MSRRKNKDSTTLGDKSSTQIDLGDDLLESDEALSQVIEVETDIHELVESARILETEGLLEEAKKIYRQILRQVPDHVRAKSQLRLIEAQEVKDILNDTSPRRYVQAKKKTVTELSIEKLLTQLDQDLSLGIRSDMDGLELGLKESRIFANAEEKLKYLKQIDQQISNGTHQDRIDLGIAFFMMELFELALVQFETVYHSIVESHEENPRLKYGSAALMAMTWLKGKKPFNATLFLEGIVEDAEMSSQDRIHFVYLLGRGFEDLGKKRKAMFYYIQLDPSYADVADRIKGFK